MIFRVIGAYFSPYLVNSELRFNTPLRCAFEETKNMLAMPMFGFLVSACSSFSGNLCCFFFTGIGMDSGMNLVVRRV